MAAWIREGERPMKKRLYALLAVLLAALFSLPAQAGGYKELREFITRETGVSPQEMDSGALTRCFGPSVPGRTALAFDLENSRALLGERAGATAFSAVCWQLPSREAAESLARAFLPRYASFSGEGTLAVSFTDEGGRLVIRSLEEAGLLALLREPPLSRSTEGADASPWTEYRLYVGNRNTKVFHYPFCPSVGDMKEKNKTPFASREDALNAGFRPCQRCHP